MATATSAYYRNLGDKINDWIDMETLRLDSATDDEFNAFWEYYRSIREWAYMRAADFEEWEEHYAA